MGKGVTRTAIQTESFKRARPFPAACPALGLCQADRQSRAHWHPEQPVLATEISGWQLSGLTAFPSASGTVPETPALNPSP